MARGEDSTTLFVDGASARDNAISPYSHLKNDKARDVRDVGDPVTNG
jgi:hypothetical protein